MAPVRIVERQTESDLRWRIVWDSQSSQLIATAAEALEAVRARDRVLVAAGANLAMTCITWEPRTKVGKAVVSVLAKTA